MPRVFLLCNRRYKPKWRLALRHAVEELEAVEVPQRGEKELHWTSEEDDDCSSSTIGLTEAVSTITMSPRSDSGDSVVPQLSHVAGSSLDDASERQEGMAEASVQRGKVHQLLSDVECAEERQTDDDFGKCHHCGESFENSEGLLIHRNRKQGGCKKPRRCPHCDKVYVSLPALSMHIRTHGTGCECPYCGKRFSRPWLLQGHIRTHTGEKPFSCPECCKAFADKSNLRAHIQTHSQTKPFVCSRCGKAFALKSYLYKHEESSCLKR